LTSHRFVYRVFCKISFEGSLFSGKTMDTQHQNTEHRLLPGHLDHIRDSALVPEKEA
jgi:hypothetical protein